jgi:phosphoglucomutase
VKYNCANGGPAPAKVTDEIFAESKRLEALELNSKDALNVDLSKANNSKFGNLELEVCDAPTEYANLMKTIFDFDKLKAFVNDKNFSMVYDSMHGVAGPFAKNIFGTQLGLDVSKMCINSEPKVDFGHSIDPIKYGHPDPNLTYAKELVALMGLNARGDIVDSKEDIAEFGAAADGDADRNMILGKQFFVTPSDSVAIIAANATTCIPWFAKNGLKGVSRSMPTSGAIDLVATKLNLGFHEVPTGWKYFGNLMDEDIIQICGEESFGTGSSHIREKDGIWAVLAWLSILAHRNASSDKFVSVEDVVREHWASFGRNYYTRYDYEGLKPEVANGLLDHLRGVVEKLNDREAKVDIDFGENTIDMADEYRYEGGH